MSTISRRDFLKGLLATGAMLPLSKVTAFAESTATEATTASGPSWFTAPKAIAENEIKETVEADVVVIGGGIAGVSAACAAQEKGASVAILEKGGKARAFGLDFGCINSSLAKEYGIPEYTEEDIYRMTRRWVAESGGKTKPSFVLQFLNNSGKAVDWIAEKAVKWGCTPVVAAYSSNSDTYENAKGIVEFHNGPTFGQGESFGVPDVVDAMTQQLADAGFPVAFNTRAVQLEKDTDGKVTGVIALNKEKEYIRYRAKKGVVLATGDFAGNKEMMDYYCAWDFTGIGREAMMNYSSGDGSGHQIAMWAGAKMRKDQPLMLLPFTYPYFYLHVNKNADRFMNEDSNSVGISVAQLSQPNGIAWSIWDNKWREELPASLEFGGGMDWDQDFRVMGDDWSLEAEEGTMQYNTDTGNLFICDTIEELAEMTELPVDRLKATIARYNELAEKGVDEDFGKRKELLTTIDQGPFYALRMNTGLCVSVGGVDVNIDHNVLDEDGCPIENLYAIGNVASDLHTDGDYVESVVPGNSIGRCVTFGKLVGEALAAK